VNTDFWVLAGALGSLVSLVVIGYLWVRLKRP